MTLKEKAKELVDKMHIESDLIFVMSKIQAKKCALIAVDEIINAIGEIFETYEERKYWEQVKQEIEKL